MGICFGTGPDGHSYEYVERHAAWGKSGSAFRRVRILKGWSLRDAANELGASVVRVSGIERGFSTMNDEEWSRFTKAVL